MPLAKLRASEFFFRNHASQFGFTPSISEDEVLLYAVKD
jgi:hypothetical protein